VGAGGSLEAAFRLAGPIKAGSWHLVGDGVTFDPCDVTFAVLWRSSDGQDHPIVSFTHSFPASGPPMNGYAPAIAYEADAMGVAAPAQANDLLVLRFTATGNPNDTTLFIPNGDGAKAQGRIPSLTLPQ
jgi:hypothetical protein